MMCWKEIKDYSVTSFESGSSIEQVKQNNEKENVSISMRELFCSQFDRNILNENGPKKQKYFVLYISQHKGADLQPLYILLKPKNSSNSSHLTCNCWQTFQHRKFALALFVKEFIPPPTSMQLQYSAISHLCYSTLASYISMVSSKTYKGYPEFWGAYHKVCLNMMVSVSYSCLIGPLNMKCDKDSPVTGSAL